MYTFCWRSYILMSFCYIYMKPMQFCSLLWNTHTKKRGEDRWQGPSSMYTLDISEYIERMPIDIISQSYIILYASIKHWYFAPAIFFYLHISALYLSFIVHTYLYFLFISFTMLKHRNLHNNFSIFLSFFPLSSLPWMICHVYSNTNALW